MSESSYDLRPPKSRDEWRRYHAIRRRVLWERRGRYGEYDENDPDEHRPNHHPLLLTHEEVPVGVIRVDLSDRQAILRRVAVREDEQRKGHGRALLQLAERFARENGCIRLYAYASPDAVTFYEKLGFEQDPANTHPEFVPMKKPLQ